MLDRLQTLPPVPLCFMAAALSGAVLLGAIAFEHWGGLPPCPLCLWQRWPHLAVVAIGVIGALGGGRLAMPCLALCMAGLMTTAGLGVFHSGVEMGWWEGLSACAGTTGPAASVEALKAQLLGAPMVRCDEVPWSFLSLSLADYNWIVSGAAAAVLLIRLSAPRQAPRKEI
ncbi:MAG: disulfide bond formation protein B [Alphaproteobacteria bacterium]|nr:disulfide bond formation protein B [Alphaproteobacteria bacterium]